MNELSEAQRLEQQVRVLREHLALQQEQIEELRGQAGKVHRNTRSITFMRNVAIVFLGLTCLVSAVDWGTEASGAGKFSFSGDRIKDLMPIAFGTGMLGALGFRRFEDKDGDGQPD